MPLRNSVLNLDEAALLNKYRISSLNPKKWEEVDYDISGSLSTLTAGTGSAAIEEDPLGLGHRIDTTDMDMNEKAQVMLSSKSFDPKVFLRVAHPDATYQDLATGIAHLRSNLDARSEAIRVLVEESFDHFVAVKASTDALYAEMRDGLIAESTDFGTMTLRTQMKAVAQKANQVFLPVLENAEKVQKLRSTLGVLERSKFFFNLPNSLMESIEAGKFDATLRDYKKGKFLLESKASQLLPTPSRKKDSTDGAGSSLGVTAQQKRILDKVWGAVERVMGELRNILMNQLKDHTRAVEEQEKTISILLELSASDEPIWVYFDSQHQHMMNRMMDAYKKACAHIEGVKQMTESDVLDDVALSHTLVPHLRAAIASIDSKQPESVIAQAPGHEVWQAVLDMVKGISEAMLSSLPHFWKIAKAHMDGKFKKSYEKGGQRRSPSQCRGMAAEVIRLYISLLSEFFTLSDIAVSSPIPQEVSPGSGAAAFPPFVTQRAHSCTTAHYLTRILAELQECVGEVSAMDVSPDASAGLRGLLESTRWRFEGALSCVWLRDSYLFYHLETWAADPLHLSTTLYLNQMQTFARNLTTEAFRIAGGIDLNVSATKPAKQYRVSANFVSKITKSFLDSLYAILDGLVLLASDEMEYKGTGTVSDMLSGPSSGRVETVDLSNPDTRLLLVVSNFGHLKNALLPSMITQLERALATNIDNDRATLTQVVQGLDHSLFDTYIKPKTAAVTEIVRRGVLDPTMDWYESPRPTVIRPYMFEILTFLVNVHAHVASVSKPLLDRTLNTLIEAIAEEALYSFRQIKKFGMGGMLRATLEIEFFHQTASRFVTATAEKRLSDVYNKISQAYVRRPGDDMKSQLDGVKKTLADTRRVTQILFLCFKKEKERDKEKEKENGRANGREKTSRSASGSGSRPQTSQGAQGEIPPPLPALPPGTNDIAPPTPKRREDRERRRRPPAADSGITSSDSRL